MICVQTQTSRNSLQLATMAGFAPQKNSRRSKASDSSFTLPSGPNFVRGMPGFSLNHSNQTEPIQGSHSGIWNGQGSQYLHQDSLSSQEQSQGFTDSFNLFPVQDVQAGQGQSRSSISGSTRSQWKAENLATHIESAEMSRFPSQDSIGAQSQRTTNSFDHGRSSRMYPSVSQMSYQMSTARSDVTGRSNSPDSVALYTPTPQIELHAFENFPFSAGEDFTVAPIASHRGSMSGNPSAGGGMSITTGSSYNMFPTTGDENFVHVPAGPNTFSSQGPVSRDAMIFNPSTVMESSTLWENGDFLDSQRSSPILGDSWLLPAAPIMNSNTDSPLDYSPSIEGLSPRYVEDFPDLEVGPYTTTGNRVSRKPIGPRPSKVASDLAAAATRRQRAPGSSENLDESFKLIGRSSLEIDNTARDHHLYHNVTPQADGLYHCPWEKDPTSNCQHKPEKLKCNYDKFVDSHLKPYKCKVSACKELQFSSTACLLRHEREAHAMHGHGDKPFLCTYDGCERGVSGNGFPRHWNLRDHMKRVHNDPGQPKSNASGSPPPPALPKNKKRKAADAPESVIVEKIAKISTPSIAQPQEPSLVDRYQKQHQVLTDLVKQMSDSRRSENEALFREAFNCIKVMTQTHRRIQAAPATEGNFSQQSG